MNGELTTKITKETKGISADFADYADGPTLGMSSLITALPNVGNLRNLRMSFRPLPVPERLVEEEVVVVVVGPVEGLAVEGLTAAGAGQALRIGRKNT